jgi:membrane protease YdiL (CAAX protease family)
MDPIDQQPQFPETHQEIATPPPPRPPSPIFWNADGLRAGWRLLIYSLFVVVLGAVVLFLLRGAIGVQRGLPSVQIFILFEVAQFAMVFAAAVIMARIEHRPVGVYGLPAREAFGGKFWLGLLLGLVEISLLMGLIAAFGGYSFGPLALHGNEILKWGLIHLVLFIFVGFFEEFLFRGYTQYTLGDGIGFWPAAFILSFGFGAVHLRNPGEGWIGAASVVLIGLFFCFTLRRTGSLWYAVGLHASFDWGETFLYSVPNSGSVMQGHLSDSLLHGSKWLTGGTVGPEGSVFCFVTIGLQFLVVMLLFPAKKTDPANEPQSLAA